MLPSNLPSRSQLILNHFALKRPIHAPTLWQDAQTAALLRLQEHARPGQIILIAGPSGAGKTLLARQFLARTPLPAVDASSLRLPDAMACECFDSLPLETALELLCQFGLGEVYTYLSPANRLSAGQQFRLRLAMAYSQLCALPGPARLLFADEFATQLDRLSAAVIARNFRRAITPSTGITAILTSSHHDILQALQPDLLIDCDFGHYQFRPAA